MHKGGSRRPQSSCNHHKNLQVKHYETLIQHSRLASKLHGYLLDKMNQLYLLLDGQVSSHLETQGAATTRKQKRVMLQKLTVIQGLVEMLRDKDFTYFTKETLFILSEDPKSRDIPEGSVALVPMLKEIFQIVKMLKAYYEMKPGVDMSYA